MGLESLVATTAIHGGGGPLPLPRPVVVAPPPPVIHPVAPEQLMKLPIATPTKQGMSAEETFIRYLWESIGGTATPDQVAVYGRAIHTKGLAWLAEHLNGAMATKFTHAQLEAAFYQAQQGTLQLKGAAPATAAPITTSTLPPPAAQGTTPTVPAMSVTLHESSLGLVFVVGGILFLFARSQKWI